MQNNQHYSKMIFKDNNNIIYQNFQVKNDKIIYPEYSNTKLWLKSIQEDDYLLKEYEYFNGWIKEDTLESVIYVPETQTNFIASKGSLEVKVQKENIISDSYNHFDIYVVFYSKNKVLYTKNAYSPNANVQLIFSTVNNFKIYNTQTIRVRVFDIQNLLNTDITVYFDIYNDLSRLNKLGMVDVKFSFISSNNPSGD